MNFSHKLIFLLVACFTSFQLQSQNFNNLHFGTDYTLDIISWNTEWFPTNGQTTVNYVKNIVEALDAEIIAFQEIDNKSQFQNLINSLDNYNGCYISNDSYQGLAYLYDKNKIQILDKYEIFENDWSEFPRSPLVLEFKFENKNYIIINNHLKCCGDGVLNTSDYDDEENRRYRACNKLNTYIDSYLNDDKVIMLGDMNDELTDSDQNNVFKNLINDEDNYLFVDMNIAEGSSSSWSYPSWPSHLDHIMITNELFATFNKPGSSCEVIKLDEFFSSWNTYESNVSDHRPVGIKLQTKEIGINEFSKNIFAISPNPFNQSFNIQSDENIESIKIFNSNGQLIFQTSVNSSNYLIETKDWFSGLYFVQIFDGKKNISTQKIIKQ